TRRLVRGTRQGRLAPAPASPRGHPHDIAGARQVGKERPALVPHHRPGGDLDVEVLAPVPGPIAPLSVASALRLEPSPVAEGVQPLQGWIRDDENGAAVPPGTAVRAAPG